MINIKGTDYKFRQSLRSTMLFESITKKPFELSNTTDTLVWYYAILLSSNKDKEPLKWDDYIDWLDESPEHIQKLTELLVEDNRIQEYYNTQEEQPTDKKKVTKKKA